MHNSPSRPTLRSVSLRFTCRRPTRHFFQANNTHPAAFETGKLIQKAMTLQCNKLRDSVRLSFRAFDTAVCDFVAFPAGNSGIREV
jgi:hypothetical protein